MSCIEVYKSYVTGVCIEDSKKCPTVPDKERQVKYMTLKEIDMKMYEIRMRLRSIEASFTRLEPYAPGFDSMLQKALELKEELETLTVERVKAMHESLDL